MDRSRLNFQRIVLSLLTVATAAGGHRTEENFTHVANKVEAVQARFALPDAELGFPMGTETYARQTRIGSPNVLTGLPDRRKIPEVLSGGRLFRRMLAGMSKIKNRIRSAFERGNDGNANTKHSIRRHLKEMVHKLGSDLLRKTKRVYDKGREYAVYKILNLVGPIVKRLGFDCIQLEKNFLAVNQGLVESLAINNGEVCGLANLRANKNVTLTREDNELVHVRVPLSVKNITVELMNVTVAGILGNLLGNEKLDVAIDNFVISADVTFKAHRFMRPVAINLQVTDMEGFRLQLKAEGVKSSVASLTLKGLSSTLEYFVKVQINSALEKMNSKVFTAIVLEIVAARIRRESTTKNLQS